MTEQSRFRFRTLEEARQLAYSMASCFPDPEAAIYGLMELCVNAIEHGNLGITYAEKTALIRNGDWQREVERRVGLPENRQKFACLSIALMERGIRLHVQDQGNGFEWEQYLEIAPERAADPHGRGIAMTRMMSFHSLEYIGCGNEVVCTVEIPALEES